MGTTCINNQIILLKPAPSHVTPVHDKDLMAVMGQHIVHCKSNAPKDNSLQINIEITASLKPLNI